MISTLFEGFRRYKDPESEASLLESIQKVFKEKYIDVPINLTKNLVTQINQGITTIDDIRDKINNNVTDFISETIDEIILKNDDASRISDECIILDPNGYLIDSKQLKNGKFSYTDPYLLGLTTARSTVVQAIKSSQLEDLDATERMLISSLTSATKNPQDAYITKKLTNYFLSDEYLMNPDKGITDLALYKQIYTAEFQDIPVKLENGLYYFADEQGNFKPYDDSRGTYETPFGTFNNPTMFKGAIYMGPLSPNNDYPGGIDPSGLSREEYYSQASDWYIDFLSAKHDVAYSEGSFFNARADLIYVAEIENTIENHPEYFGRNKHGVNTMNYAKFGAFWFKNISPYFSRIVGNTEGVNDIYSGRVTDFYDEIMKDHIPVGLIENDDNVKNPYIKRGRLLIRNEARMLFYKGLTDQIKIEFEKAKKDFVNNEMINKLNLIRF